MDENQDNQLPPIQDTPTQPLQTELPPFTPADVQESPLFASSPESEKKKFNKKLIIISAAVVLVFLVVSGTVAFGYDALPIKNPQLESKISGIMMAVPFMPKTTQYVLGQAYLANSQITKGSFNLSLAADSGGSQLAGGVHYDAQVSGSIDNSDSQNPVFSLNAAIIKDLNIDLIGKDKNIFFRIDSLPADLKLLLPTLAKVKPQWYEINSQTMNTDARNSLNQNLLNQQKLQSQDTMNTLVNAIYNPVYAKNITMTQETLQDVIAYNTYHIHFTPDATAIDTMMNNSSSSTKSSDIFKNVTIDAWVDRDQYYVYKMQCNFSIDLSKVQSTSSASIGSFLNLNQQLQVAAVLKFSNFNQPVTVTPPSGAQDYTNLIKSLQLSQGF